MRILQNVIVHTMDSEFSQADGMVWEDERIVAVGNSDGDLQMLQYSTAHGARSLQVLVHHDDAQREYAYDHGAEKALAAAAEHGWAVVSMKRDFRRVFPFEAPGKR